jgi:hypothetical protein
MEEVMLIKPGHGPSAFDFASIVFSLLVVGFATPAHADTTYNYTGQPFNLWTGEFSCSGGVGECGMSGSFTVSAPLGDNLDLASVTPVSYSFTDGVQMLTNLNSSIEYTLPPTLAFLFSTNASGQITQYDIALLSDTGEYEFFIYNFSGITYDAAYVETTTPPITALGLATNASGSGPPPGTWSTTPEPSTLSLLVTGLLLTLGASRKRLLSRRERDVRRI